jgi:hypothetical protein
MRRMTIGIALAALSAAIAVPALAAPAGAAPSGGAAAKPAATANGAHAAAPAGTARTTADVSTADGAKSRNQPAPEVSTSHLDGTCNYYSNYTGDLCLWYYQSFYGSKADFYYADSNLWNNYFVTPGAGQGRVVANNAESDFNYDRTYTAWVCQGINYTGTCGYIPPWTGGNFVYPTFKNNVESFYWS